MIINNLSRFQTHWDYETSGLGMLFPRNQNWTTSRLPWSISLANSVNTGVSFDTPSGAIAERQRWARRGMGCGCGCGGAGACGHGHGGDWMPLVCLAAIAAAAYWMGKGNGFLA